MGGGIEKMNERWDDERLDKEKTLLEILNNNSLSDEQWEEFKHLHIVYMWIDDSVFKKELTREDYKYELSSKKIIVDKISLVYDVRSIALFDSEEEAFVDMYNNNHRRKIQRLQMDLRALEPYTEKYREIIEEKPHLAL